MYITAPTAPSPTPSPTDVPGQGATIREFPSSGGAGGGATEQGTQQGQGMSLQVPQFNGGGMPAAAGGGGGIDFGVVVGWLVGIALIVMVLGFAVNGVVQSFSPKERKDWKGAGAWAGRVLIICGVVVFVVTGVVWLLVSGVGQSISTHI